MIAKITGLPVTARLKVPAQRAATLSATLTGALTALACSTAIAFSGGSPITQCTIDPAKMAQVMGAPSVPSPNGWSFSVPSTYTPGGNTAIAIRHTDANKQFRGILLWLTRPDGVTVGSWNITSDFQPCESSLMHNSNTAKLQQTFTYFPPSSEASTLTVRAVLVEECGLGRTCAAAHPFLTAVMVPSVGVMNIDASAMETRYDAATDGVLLLRYLLGYTGAALTNGALGSLPSRNAGQIVSHLDSNRTLLDVDGDNEVRPLTDGLLILRYLLGLRGTALTSGAARGSLTPDQISARILIVLP